MPPRAIGVIPAAIVTAPTPERQNFVHSSYPHDGRTAGPSSSRTNYGAVVSGSTDSSPGSRKGKEPAVGFSLDHEYGYGGCDSESCDSDDGMEPLVDSELPPVWRCMNGESADV